MILVRACPVFTYSCDLFYGLVGSHLSSHCGQKLTGSKPCPSLPFTHSNSSVVVTGIPTDVNWEALKRPDVVLLSSLESDILGCSFTPARELSDAMSALLYNLDNTITLKAKEDQRA